MNCNNVVSLVEQSTGSGPYRARGSTRSAFNRDIQVAIIISQRMCVCVKVLLFRPVDLLLLFQRNSRSVSAILTAAAPIRQWRVKKNPETPGRSRKMVWFAYLHKYPSYSHRVSQVFQLFPIKHVAICRKFDGNHFIYCFFTVSSEPW